MRTASISSQPIVAVWIFTCSIKPHPVLSGPVKTIELSPDGLITSTHVTNPDLDVSKISIIVPRAGVEKLTSNHSAATLLLRGVQALPLV
jgi:hypothetical protein